MAIESGVTRSSVQRILKSDDFHPHEIHLLQELNEDDFVSVRLDIVVKRIGRI